MVFFCLIIIIKKQIIFIQLIVYQLINNANINMFLVFEQKK